MHAIIGKIQTNIKHAINMYVPDDLLVRTLVFVEQLELTSASGYNIVYGIMK